MSEQNGKNVSWYIFYGMTSLLLIGIGWNLTRTETLAKQVDDYRQNVQLIQVSQASMQADLVWIKTALTSLQISIDKQTIKK